MGTGLRRVLDGQAELAQVAAELLDALVVALDGVRRELRQLVSDALRLRHLPGPAPRNITIQHWNLSKLVLRS